MYRHTQHAGALIWVPVLAGGAAVGVALAAARTSWAAWVALGALIVVGLTFTSLTVAVTHERLTFWFGQGLVRRSFLLSQIRSCAVVTNPWWYGWGIHLTPRGWLYNVSGRRAVELALTDGRTVRVGSDEPEAVCRMLRQMKGTPEAPTMSAAP